jgi:sortase A
VRRVISAIGRTLVTAGILILLFVAYQLWGTGLYTDREQDKLHDAFIAELARSGEQTASSTTSSPSTSTTLPIPTTTTTAPVALSPTPQAGDAVAQIIIPRISLDSIVVEGVGRPDLRKGPGHYPDSPFPGQEGNSAIAGHRTTYGAPFGDLDRLEDGDKITVRTVQGEFTYIVYEAGLVVRPTDVAVLNVDPNRPATLTLTTCNPKYSAQQRLVVKGELEEEPLPPPKHVGKAKLTDEGLSGEKVSKRPTLVTGAIAVLIGLLWWIVFHRHPRWTSWLIGVIPFAVALFFFYAYLERVLPANY